MVCDLTSLRQEDFISDVEDFLFAFNSNVATNEINFQNFNRLFHVFIVIISDINKHCPNKLISRKKTKILQKALDNEGHLKFYS